MESEKHPIDELFRGALASQEVSAPQDAWHSIEQALDRKSRMRRINLAWAAAASIAMLTAFAGGYFLATKKAVNSNMLVTSQQVGTVNNNNPVIPSAGQSNSASQQSPVTKQSIARSGLTAKTGNPIALNDRLFVKLPETSTEQNSPVKETTVSESNNTMLFALRPLDGRLIPAGYAVPYRLSIPDSYAPVSDAGTEEIMVVAENNETRNDREVFLHKWSLGGQVAPLYAYRNVQTVNQEQSFTSGAVRTPNSVALNNNESPLLSYAGGLNVQYEASRRLKIMSGLYYARMGQNVSGNVYNSTYGAQLSGNESKVYSFENSTGSIGVISSSMGTNDLAQNITDAMGDVNNIPTVELAQQFDYLELPLILKYRLIDKRFGVNLIGGLATDFLVNNQVIARQDGKNDYVNETAGIRTTNYSSQVGFGFDYAVTELIRVSLEPGFRYYLTSVNTNHNIDVHPYAFGVYTGLSFTF
jgi:hypothetical protein